MTHNGSAKYISNGTGIGAQTISKGGRQRWANMIRGYATKNGDTGIAAQHHGSNIRMQPARNRRSVWTVPTRPFKGAHFATFPPALIRLCVSAGCPPDGVVLDPFMGSGTTAIVTKELGRKYVGIELNSDYASMAENRIDGACAPQNG